jgi:putative addiction module component (TIGR02574 family)
MTEAHRPFDFTQLSPAERILLVQDIWDSLFREGCQVAISDEQKQELDSRWDRFQSGAMSAAPWPEVKNRLPRE